MTTPWGEKVTSENCWRDYPRPHMVRKGWTCLNGDWDYAVTPIISDTTRSPCTRAEACPSPSISPLMLRRARTD
mgnify:CR=1 FL=1